MTNQAFRSLVTIATLLLVGSFALASFAESQFRWETAPGSSLALIGEHGIVWKFNFSSERPKPFFDPVALVSGESLTWNEPPDHAWHHGLWFSWKTINGTHYWETVNRTNPKLGETTWNAPKVATSPDGSARIEMDILYTVGGADPVVYEKRIIEVSSPNSDGQYHFDWDATFRAGEQDVVFDRTPIPPDPNGVPWGGYAGLSVRFAKNLSEREAVTERGPASYDKDGIHRSAGQAFDYHGKLNNQPAGIAILAHSENPRAPTPWYAIRSNMSYLNPAFLADKPYSLKAHDEFRLRYRLIVHPGIWKAERLKKASNDYANKQ